MKRLLLLFHLLVLTALLQQAAAQDRSISGQVTDRANGQGLPGVTVLVKGTTTGASTNADGTYVISVPASATTLSFSSIGYLAVERPINGATINVALSADTKQLNEVVVTAQNVERTRNSLAYSATVVEGDQITKARNPNFINGLQGKVSGVAIQQSNTLGGSTNVLIRGTKSLFGNNQPLFVVDGVPISNTNTNSGPQNSTRPGSQQTGTGGYDYGNAAADINPDDIASTTILKGAAATALYGERASNGVVMITTKKSRKGLGVTINAGVTLGRVDKSTFIKYQNKYGGGYGAYYEDASGYFLYRPVGGSDSSLVTPTSEDASYGGRFNPNLNVYQWDAFDPTSPNFNKATPWVAATNTPASIFETAVTLNNTINITGGNDKATFKAGYASIRDKGILPNSHVNKNIVNASASLNLTSRLTVSTAVTYTRIDGLGRYGTGYNSQNLMGNFRQWWQTNVDIKEQEAAYNRSGRNVTWNWADPTDLRPIYWNNPYWVRYENYENDARNRVFGNVVATYKVTDWFNVLGRVTNDSYDEIQEERNAVGSVGVSSYSRFNRTSRENNFDLIGNFTNHKFGNGFSIQGLIGVNLRRQAFSSIYAATNGGLVVPKLYALSNSANPIIAPTESETRVGVDGVYASATLGFRDMVFLDLTTRRDKSTTLPSAHNTYYYPSAALGFVFSELMKEVPWMSYGKVRANYAEVGSSAPPQAVYDVYDKPTGFGAAPLFSLPGTKNNPDLKPERTKSLEAGLEMAFFRSRIGFDATVYQQNTVDQIIPVNVSTATGYNSRYVNSGEVRNRGVEVGVFGSPVQTKDFTWTVNLNWTRNRNQVLSLYNGVDNLLLANYQGGITSNAAVGQAFGTIRGTDFVYLNDDKEGGQRIVGDNGYYQRTTQSNIMIANPNPKWTGGVSNTFNYKGIGLYFLIDLKHGGQLFSLDRYYGLATGLQPETAALNDLGNESRAPLADGGGVILPGVLADGTPNTKRVSNTNYGLYGYARLPNSAFVYDAGYAKLREASISYTLPTKLVSKFSGVGSIDISLVGRNLWIIKKYVPDADPEDALSSGNYGQGYQSGSYPAVRTFGANVRISF